MNTVAKQVANGVIQIGQEARRPVAAPSYTPAPPTASTEALEPTVFPVSEQAPPPPVVQNPTTPVPEAPEAVDDAAKAS